MKVRNGALLSFVFGLLLVLALARHVVAQAVTATVSLPGPPTAIVVNPVSKQTYVAYEYFYQSCTPLYGCRGYTGTKAATINESTNSVATLWSGYAEEIFAGEQLGTVAANPVTNQVYVLPVCCGVTVIDGATNTATPIDVSNFGLFAAAVNPLTNKIYVTNDYIPAGFTVAIIDGATNATTTITDPKAVGPWAVDANPATNKIYVANNGSANVTVIDGATNTFASVPAGNSPIAVAVNPITNKVYVVNNTATNGTVTVIDGATNATTTVPVGGSPTAIGINPVTNKIYVANNGSNNITVIDGATNATRTLSDATASQPNGVAVDALTNQIYVVNAGSATITVIDGASNALTTVTLPSASGSSLIALDPVSDTLYALNGGSNNISVIAGVAGTAAPDFAMGATSTNLTLAQGGQASDTIVVGPPYGNTVNLSCSISGPAPLPSCELSATSVTPGSTYGTATLTISAPGAAAMLAPSHHPWLGGFYAAWLALMFGIPVMGGSRRRGMWLRGGLLLLFSIALVACGGSGTSKKTPTHTQTNYTVTVTGTSGAIQQTTQVAVTVD